MASYSDIYNIPPSVWNAMTREEQQAVLTQLADAAFFKQQEAEQAFQEANKPPSSDEELLTALGSMAALPAGYWLGNTAFDAIKGAGTAQTAAQSVAPAAQQAAQTAAPAVAQSGAQGLTQIGSMASGAPMLGSSVAPAVASAPWYAAPAGSGAEALGSTIGTGLETLGVGAETAGSLGAFLGPAAMVAGGLYGGYQLANNLMDNQKDPFGGAASGAATGAAIGSFLPGPGTVIGAGVGGLLGLGAGMIGGNKDKDQLGRDAVRSKLKGAGIIGDNYQLTRADGSTFDIGKDGDAMLKNAAGQERRYFDVDFNDANAASVVGAVDPLAAIISGGDEKLRNDYAGYFANYVLGGGDPQANVQRLYEQFGMNKDTAWEGINQLESKGRIDQQMGHVFRNGLNNVFSGGQFVKAQTPGQPQQLQQTIPTSKGEQLQLAGGKSRLMMGAKTPPPNSIKPVQLQVPGSSSAKPSYSAVAQALLQGQAGQAQPGTRARLGGLNAYSQPGTAGNKDQVKQVAWAMLNKLGVGK